MKIAYFFAGLFVFCWWGVAFREEFSFLTPSPKSEESLPPSSSLSLDRIAFHRALSGDFREMGALLSSWFQETAALREKYPAELLFFKENSVEERLYAKLLAHLVLSDPETAHAINQILQPSQMKDDSGRMLPLSSEFKLFLPQTYAAASFLLSICPPQKLAAIPAGLKTMPQLYSGSLLQTISLRASLSQLRPDLAFVAPYSSPYVIERLRNQGVVLCSMDHRGRVDKIATDFLKIGEASMHSLEAALAVFFFRKAVHVIDTQFRALWLGLEKKAPLKILYLTQRCDFWLPGFESQPGGLLSRALSLCEGWECPLSKGYHAPYTKEEILHDQPDILMISASHPESVRSSLEREEWMRELTAFRNKKIFYLDEVIQNSPTQYLALAYLDLFLALKTALVEK